MSSSNSNPTGYLLNTFYGYTGGSFGKTVATASMAFAMNKCVYSEWDDGFTVY